MARSTSDWLQPATVAAQLSGQTNYLLCEEPVAEVAVSAVVTAAAAAAVATATVDAVVVVVATVAVAVATVAAVVTVAAAVGLRRRRHPVAA